MKPVILCMWCTTWSLCARIACKGFLDLCGLRGGVACVAAALGPVASKVGQLGQQVQDTITALTG